MPNFNSKHILITTAAAGLAATGIATAAPGPSGHTAGRRIQLIERQRSSTQLDLGKKGFSAGDRQTITSDVLTPAGRKIGRLDDDCAITQADKQPEAVCTFVISLPHGQLTGTFAQSLSGPDAGKRQAITGGTGIYAGEHGQIVAGPEGNRTRFAILLR